MNSKRRERGKKRESPCDTRSRHRRHRERRVPILLFTHTRSVEVHFCLHPPFSFYSGVRTCVRELELVWALARIPRKSRRIEWVGMKRAGCMHGRGRPKKSWLSGRVGNCLFFCPHLIQHVLILCFVYMYIFSSCISDFFHLRILVNPTPSSQSRPEPLSFFSPPPSPSSPLPTLFEPSSSSSFLGPSLLDACSGAISGRRNFFAPLWDN